MRSSILRLTSIVFVVGLLGPAISRAADQPIKVFILAGQSNMVGHGKVETGRNPNYDPKGPKGEANAPEIPGGLGSLRAMVNDNPDQFGPHGKTPLVDPSGKWLVSNNVKIYAIVDNATKKGNLTIGFGAGEWIGPEYGFGTVVGNAIHGDVLIVKVSIGGTSLAGDWRPPSAVAKRGGTVGPRYTQMVDTVKKVLANLGTDFPEFAGRDYQIAGFGWHQGWNDAVDKNYPAEYEANMADFIRDVRTQWGERLPFVIATSGQGGPTESGGLLTVLNAQTAMADPAKYPEFAGTVAVVDTRPMWQPPERSPSNFGYHWNHNGITHFQIGQGMGEAMIKLLSPPDHSGR